MSDELDEQWHGVLSERNVLRGALEAVTDALRQYHDDHHVGPARWCDAPPCRLAFGATESPAIRCYLSRRTSR